MHFPEQMRAALEELKLGAPGLVAGWSLTERISRRTGPAAIIDRGPEKPKFEMPGNDGKKGKAAAAKPAPPPPRRRWLQL